MPILRYVSLLERDVASYLTGVTDLDVRLSDSGDYVLYATSRSGEAISAFSVAADGSTGLADHQTLSTEADRTEFISIGDTDYVVTLAPQEDSTRLYALDTNGHLTGTALTLTAETAAMHSLVQMQVGQESYLYCTDADSGALDAFRIGPDGSLALVAATANPTNVASLARADIGSAQYLVMADADGQHVRSYRVGNDGSLTEGGVCGADQGLGVAGISTLDHVNLPDGHYVVVAACDSSSLSVLRMETNGTLTPVDHIIDDLTTRFQNVTSVETVMLGNRAFIIAGGGDDGVSFFELLPGGRLLLHDTIPDAFTTTLANVSAIGAIAADGQLQIFVGSGTETGITQFNMDPGPLGATLIDGANSTNLVGSDAGEVLAGRAGNDVIDGGEGDDILMDGVGQDTLIGGSGRDVFVLEADGSFDEIRDFDPNQDRIDLTAWPMLRNLGQISFTIAGNGAILQFGQEELRIYSHNGLPLAQHQVLTDDLIGLTRIPAVLPEPVIDEDQIVFIGDDAANLIVGNGRANTLDGGLGNDTIRGGDGADSIVGGGGTDSLEGEGGNDTLNATGGNGNVLRGGLGDDQLNGGWGNDVLQGNSGADSFSGGTGADDLYIDADDVSFDGGGGYDRLIVASTAGVSVALAGTNVERVIGGVGGDVFDGTGVATTLVISGEGGNDTLTGGDAVDQISGGDNDDVLNGGGGNDFLFGDGGSDSFNGGAGNDQFFAESGDSSFNGGADYDRLFIQDNGDFNFALAGSGVERVNSGGGNDTLDATGVTDSVVLSGAGGNDILTGGSAGDVLAGGEGDDTIEGGADFDSLFGNGGSDTFVFNDGSGTDFLVGWEDGLDRMDFSGHSLVSGLGDLTITDNGTNTRIAFAGGDAVIVLGYTGGFDASDFVF
ncbi:hypothetical protein [Nioella aestuarii]|uniref:hypothetical protein n=1 Tax=Nioella aestuarii TaxID=1662864 RepID=UPI003D7FC6A6